MEDFKLIHHLFEYHSSIHAHHIALRYSNELMTYEALNNAANQAAHFLLAQGIGSGDLVPIIAEKSCSVFIILLAILKTGAAFILMHSDIQEQACAKIMTQSNASVICSSAIIAKRLAAIHFKLINLDTLFEKIRLYPTTNISSVSTPEQLAYVIYTSGTTGIPKGVMVTHENMLHTYNSWREVYQLSANDIHLQMAAIGFDVFIGDMLRALCSGAQLVLCSKEVLTHPDKLYQLIEDSRITCAEFVPSVLRGLLLQAQKDKKVSFAFIRLVLCGSDVWTIKEYKEAKRVFGVHVRVINSYGVTEATIDSTYFEADEPLLMPDDMLVPIGIPFPHVTAYVLNDDLQPTLPHQVGELHLGGFGVALGYLGQTKRTAERFIYHPQTKERLYKTGDLCALSSEHAIEFLGRNQFHVKINGQRIELLMLDALLNQHAKIKHAISYDAISPAGIHYLGCWLVAWDESISLKELVEHIKCYAPIHYIPQQVDLIVELKCNQNGKVDRTPAAQQVIKSLRYNNILPSNELEMQLVALWRHYLYHYDICVERSFSELGGSSLDFVSMLDKVNRTFNLSLSSRNVPITIKELAHYIYLLVKQNEAAFILYDDIVV